MLATKVFTHVLNFLVYVCVRTYDGEGGQRLCVPVEERTWKILQQVLLSTYLAACSFMQCGGFYRITKLRVSPPRFVCIHNLSY